MDEKQVIQEVEYKAVRSSGPGGQNVNKVASKVELHFDLESSQAFQESEKQRLTRKLQNRLTRNGELILQCDESRSQHKNKEIVTERFMELLKSSLIKPKPRKKTKVPKKAKLKRLQEKKINAEKKQSRRNPLKD